MGVVIFNLILWVIDLACFLYCIHMSSKTSFDITDWTVAITGFVFAFQTLQVGRLWISIIIN
jgi:hypothetical protein